MRPELKARLVELEKEAPSRVGGRCPKAPALGESLASAGPSANLILLVTSALRPCMLVWLAGAASSESRLAVLHQGQPDSGSPRPRLHFGTVAWLS